jgi:hypothetical protein
MRDCSGCTAYRAQLRGVREGLGALSPGPGPLAALLKLVGLGGAAGGGVASGGAAAGGGAVVVAGGGTAAKMTAVVCCAALAAGGAAEVTHKIIEPSHGNGGGAAASQAPSAQAGTIPTHRTGSAVAAAGGAARSAVDAAKRRAAGVAGAGSAGAEITRNTTSPTRAAEVVPGAATGADPADRARRGGRLRPRRRRPDAALGDPSGRLTCADPAGVQRRRDRPGRHAAGGGQAVLGDGLVGRNRAGIVQVAS